MISKIIIEKASFLKGKSEESQILFIYRYISLFITSTFYFLNHSEHLIIKKIFIIACLTVAATILSYLYLMYEKSYKNIKILILIETIGNSILLIPSGGINSPFIWYTLNTILISSVFFKKIYCWINLFVYLISSIIIIYFGDDNNLNISKFVKEESNLILSFIMIIAAVQVWSIFIRETKDKSKRLEELNIQLELANNMIMESIDHIKTLYKSVNILTIQGNKEGLTKLLFEYTEKITRTNTVFYYDISENINKIILEGNNNSVEFLLEENITRNLKNILKSKLPMEMYISNTRFIIVPVKSSYKDYGILGFQETSSKESIIYSNNMYQIQFLSELISAAFEKFYLQEINERLLITEEQNRIANEIHDSVLQRLFSMSCGVFSLIKKLDKYTAEDIEKELNTIRKTADVVMKELRKKIYGLSWKKSGYNSFTIDIRQYIDDIKKLNNINISFHVIGSDELLSCKQKKAIYRIICEGIGNAVRHGKANNIETSLKINSCNIVLSIIDDGTGFDLNRVIKDKTGGLGIQNIYQLTESIGGNIKIDSKLGSNTKITLMIPNNVVLIKGDEAIV